MTTLSLSPGTSTDDGQWGSGSGYSNAASIVVGGYYGSGNGWFRVTNVTIAGGSTISDFRLRGTPLSAAGTADMKFHFIKEANPTYPTSGSDADGRTKTTAYVTGSYSGTGAFTSANCATPAQEVVDQGTWASGNSQIFYALDDDSNTHHGAFENRITFRSQDYGTDIPILDWTYSSSIQAAVPSGTISLTGVAPTVRKKPAVVVGTVTFAGVTPTVPTAIQAAVVVGTITSTGVALTSRHSAPVVVGTVAITGVSPTSKHQAAVAVGTLTLTGVAPTSVHYAGASVGAVALAGVTPGSTHRAAVVVGSVVFTGVAPGSRHSAAVSVGSVVLGFGICTASIQDVTFNGSTTGGALVSFNGNLATFQADPIGDDLTAWQAAVTLLVFPFTATASLIAGGFRITFSDTAYHDPIAIITDSTDLGTTITQKQIGGNYCPVSVRKDVGVSVGTFTFSGVLPATRHRAAVEVGSVVFAGVTPTADYGFTIDGPFFAMAATNWQPGDVAGTSYQPGDKAGTNTP